MEKISINNEILATKILNELKYNKRLLYNWTTWFDEPTEQNLRKKLKLEIENLVSDINNGREIKLQGVDAIPVYKNIVKDDEEKEDNVLVRNIVSFSASQRISGKLNFNYFIKIGLQDFILSAIWVETVGKLLDSSLSSDVYANRLSANDSYFFKPYFEAYSSFRDSNFKKMRNWITNEETGIYIQTDLSRFFYRIDTVALKSAIDEKISEHKNLTTLNNHIFKIIDSYNSLKNIVEFKTKVLKLENEKIAVLPIGFLPSNILANIYLVDLDRLIEEQFYPVNYGRYVDDISFLVKKRISDGDNETTVKKIIEDIGKIKDEIEKKYVELNKDKTLFFIIDKKNDINYLNKFEKETQKLSSDNYRLIDPNEYDKEFENAYNLTKDITKMSDLFTIVRDKKFISRTISTIFYYIFWNLKKDIHEQNIELSKKFIKYFYSFVDDEFFLELFDYWYQLCIIELISNGIEIGASTGTGINICVNFQNRCKSLIQYATSSDNEMLNEFLENYNKFIGVLLASDKESLLFQLQEYFRLPKYKLENLVENEYLLNYERQLRSLVKIDSLTPEEFEKIIRNNFSNKNNSEQFKDYDIKNKLIVGQSNFYSYDERKKYFLKTCKNKSNMGDIIKTLNEADREKVDLLLYPEQGVALQDFVSLTKFAVRTKTLIIGGLDFIYLKDTVYNLTFIIKPIKTVNGRIEYKDAQIIFLHKVYPSPEEYTIFHNSRPKDGNNWEIYIPNKEEVAMSHVVAFRGYTHAVLNCYEATSIELKYAISKDDPEIVHLITNNRDIKYYYQIAETLSRDLMAITSITNYSKLGGVEVYIPYKTEYLRRISSHKGSKNTHIDICCIDLDQIRQKRLDNNDSQMKQNPPKYYYKNIGVNYE